MRKEKTRENLGLIEEIGIEMKGRKDNNQSLKNTIVGHRIYRVNRPSRFTQSLRRTLGLQVNRNKIT